MYNNLKRSDLKKIKNPKTKTEKIILYHCVPTNFLNTSVVDGAFYPKYGGIFLADSDKGAFRGSQRKYESFKFLSIISVKADLEKLETWKNNISQEAYGDEFYFYAADMIPHNEWELVATFSTEPLNKEN